MANKQETSVERELRAEKGWLLRNMPVQDLFELSGTPMLVHFQGKVEMANPACLELLGAEKESDIVGLDVLSLVHPDFRETVRKRVAKAVSTQSHAESLREKLLRLDGSAIYCEVVGIPVPFRDGTAVFAMVRDLTEQERQEARLRESEERFENLVNDLQVGVMVADENSQIVLTNPAAQELLGLKQEEILGRSCMDPDWDVIDESGKPMAPEEFPISRAINSGHSVSAVVMGVARPNLMERIWVLASADPVFDAAGSLQRVVCSFSDLTERKVAEMARMELETRFRMVVEGLGECVIITDLDDAVVFANDRLFELTGYKEEEVIGKVGYRIWLPQEDWETAKERNSRRREGIEETYEKQMIRKDGSIIWVSVCATPFRSVTGEVIGTLGALSDVTDRHRAEEAVLKSEERLHLALESSNDGMWDWNLTTGEVYKSPELNRLLGHPESETIQTRDALRSIVLPEDLVKIDESLNRHFEGSGSRFEFETRLRLADGSIRWFRSCGKVAERDAEGQPLRVIGTLSDIDSIKRTNEELQKARDMLELRVEERTRQLSQANAMLLEEIQTRKETEEKLKQSNAELEAFAHSISHDLKAPLRAIAGFAAALEEDFGEEIDDGGKEHIEVIKSSVERMDSMLEDLLSLARLGKRDAKQEPIDLNLAVQLAVENLTAQISSAHATIAIQPHLPTVHGHRWALIQLIQNLISNALKFVPPERSPQIELGASVSDGTWHLWVKDNGIGIEESYRSKVFEPFERLHRKEEYPGTGIGLAIVKKAANLHDGEVWFESKLGVGSTFHIRAPLNPAMRPADQPS